MKEIKFNKDKEIWQRLTQTFSEQIGILKTLGSASKSDAPVWYIKVLLEKLEKAYKGAEVQFTTNEIEDLCFHLGETTEKIQRFFISSYLENDWDESFASALNAFLVLNWNRSTCKEVRILLEHKSCLNEYLRSDGPVSLTKQLNKEASTPLASIKYIPECTSFNAPYYSDVIKVYYLAANAISSDLSSLSEILENHGDVDVERIVLADFIIRSEASGQLKTDRKQQLMDMVYHFLGDTRVSTTSKWYAHKLPSVFAEKLEKARTIIERWKAQKFVYDFWNRIRTTDTDPNRANFWMRNAKYLRGSNEQDIICRFICSTWKYNSLVTNRMTNNYIDWKANPLPNDNVAILMRFGEYTIVDFLNQAGGCAYFFYRNQSIWYRTSDVVEWTRSQDLPELQSQVISNIASVRSSSVKISHRGHWTDRFMSFFTHKVLAQNIYKVTLNAV